MGQPCTMRHDRGSAGDDGAHREGQPLGGLLPRDVGVDLRLKHVERQSAGVQHHLVEVADVELRPQGFLGLGRSPQKKAREALTELVGITGGRAYFPKSIDEVEAICRQIAHELRNQYTLGYYPKNEQRDGTRRLVTVNVLNPPKSAGKLTIHAPTEYVAPGGPSQ